MKQLLILSGKGGTGKTTLCSSLIKLSDTKAYADCDVDAPNLHLVMGEKNQPSRKDFYGLPAAFIDPKKCISCDLCRLNCRFDAISFSDTYVVDNYSCEGCKVCSLVCPADAIEMKPRITGKLSLYENHHLFSTAELCIGSGNSGLLVTEVKKGLAKSPKNVNIGIIDGSPGIGCPVIASISGVELVILVTEPTLSGFSDMKRIIKTAAGFPSKLAVVINKYTLHMGNTELIKEFCKDNEIPLIGMIPYDVSVLKSINAGRTPVEEDGPIKDSINHILSESLNILKIQEVI